jgi:rod shape-determining protein MreC
MARAAERSAERRDFWLVAVCLLASIGALFAPQRAGASIAEFLRHSILAPLVYMQGIAVDGRQTRARFAGVSAERDSARLAAQQLPGLKAENDELRALLGFSRRLARRWRPAEVLHQQQPTDGRMLLVNAGARDGIREFAPVVSSGGLVGVVRSVGTSSSLVMTWAHPDWRASATTADGKAYGMVSASNATTASGEVLEFHAVSFRDSLPRGTLIVSAGLGGVYPQGIPLGVVEGIASQQAGWERTYRLRPSASPSAATHVLILDATADGPMAEAFPADTPASPKPATPAVGPGEQTLRDSGSGVAPPAAVPSGRPTPGDSVRKPARRRPDTTTVRPATPPDSAPARDSAP